MRVIINQLKGGEKLEKDVQLENGMIILPAGTVIKKDYILKLKEMKIFYVHIECENESIIDPVIEEKIKQQCQVVVKNTIEKYSYCGDVQLKEITKVAEDIMDDILSEPEVMYNVSCVRDRTESTYSHSINVSALSVMLAIRLGLGEERVRDIAIGSLLHDIGLVYIPQYLLGKDLETCSEKQVKEIRSHVIIGYSVLEREKWLSNRAKEIILSHHERCDGSGYPMRLRANKLHLDTKIVALCDEFDNQVYGSFTPKRKVKDVIEYLVSQADAKFDFRVVKVFNESVAAYPNGTYVITSENEVGIVVRQNEKMPIRPVIRMITDADGHSYEQYVEKDLTKDLTLFIRDSIQ
ncbi:MAG: HD domain-containing protein [Lachnospiraceae bacterium]|nr:HD domain-containing protein [Lachnospiraceae bacterium]